MSIGNGKKNLVTVQPRASLLQNPAHLKFVFSKGLDSLAELTHSYGLCSKCKALERV